MTKQIEQPIKYGKNDVEIISKRKLFNGFFQMVEYQFRHRLFAGDGVKKFAVKFLNAAMLAWFYPMTRKQIVLF